MNLNTNRRKFLRNALLATASISLLPTPQFVYGTVLNEIPYEGYNPYSEQKQDLRKGGLFSSSVSVKGKIFQRETGTPLSNAKIEIWHLSPNSNSYRHHGYMHTDANGEYQFITDTPNKEPGKSMRIYFKITHDHKMEYTELSLNGRKANITSKHWEQNQILGNTLFPKCHTYSDQAYIEFNISI